MEYKIGEIFEYKKTFTIESSRIFAELTGDNNPVHSDFDYAKKTKFAQPVVHGALTNSLFSTIFGTIFPGPGCIYISQTTKFVRPVFFDQEIVARVELIEVNEKKIAMFSTKCVDKDGNLLLTGEAKVLIP